MNEINNLKHEMYKKAIEVANIYFHEPKFVQKTLLAEIDLKIERLQSGAMNFEEFVTSLSVIFVTTGQAIELTHNLGTKH